MTITDSDIQRVRTRIQAFNTNQKRVERLHRQRSRLSDFAASVEAFLNGGNLGNLATDHRRAFPGGRNILREMADFLSGKREMTEQIRALVQVPKDDDVACRAIDTLVRLIEARSVVADPQTSLSALAPVILANCWHVQEPQVWQPYSVGIWEDLAELLPEFRELKLNEISHQNRYLEINSVLINLATKLQINAWEVAAKIRQANSDDVHSQSRSDWLMAFGKNASVWERCYSEGVAMMHDDRVGDLSQYEDKAQLEQRGLGTNDSRACWEFCRVMKPGDTIFVKKGRRLVLGHGVVRSDYRFDSARSEYRHVRNVDWLSKTDGVCPRGKLLVAKKLTNITKFTGQVDQIKSALNIQDPKPVESGTSQAPDHAMVSRENIYDSGSGPPYTMEEARKDLFLTDDEIESLVTLLRRKRNLVLQGPPGTGKTYVAQRLAWLLTGEQSRDHIEAVQFHQSYGYEDFVRGYRPTETGGFELQDGPFLRFCAGARAASDRPYVLIIDEINRGNLSRIFGELLMLIEVDKRSLDWAVHTAYSRPDEAPFHVPENLYVIGSMNTADRSLALVDYALRRRFAFANVMPAFYGVSSERFKEHLVKNGVPEAVLRRICDRFEKLNHGIRNHPQLGADFQIGHSYFCQPPAELASQSDWDNWYEEIVRYEIEPLLHEYWFDDQERVESELASLRSTSSPRS